MPVDSFSSNTQNICRETENVISVSEFHNFITVVCMHCGHTVSVPVYCGNRFCQICSSPRQKRVKNRINWLIKHRTTERGTMLKHLTLTIKNDLDLSAMVKHLVKSFRKMRQRKLFKAKIIGGAFVVELTNKGNGWHAHIHCIIQSHRIEWKDLLKMWMSVSGGNTGVYIRNIPPVQAVRYLTKYITKSDLPIELQKKASGALMNYRLFNPFGTWYNINRKYEQPISRCPKCDTVSCFMPWDLIYTLSGSPPPDD